MLFRSIDDDPELVRRMLIALFEDPDNWRFTDTALNQGRVALKKACGKIPTDCWIIDYIVELLRSGFPLVRTPMGEPTGSRGVGWVMHNPDGNDTYIKLKIEQDGVYDIAWVISCHTSKHQKTN